MRQRMLREGMSRANAYRLPLQTEASPRGESFYLKNGFQRIGTWHVHLPGYKSGGMEVPVMRLKLLHVTATCLQSSD
jgi:hypothetical protein